MSSAQHGSVHIRDILASFLYRGMKSRFVVHLFIEFVVMVTMLMLSRYNFCNFHDYNLVCYHANRSNLHKHKAAEANRDVINTVQMKVLT